MPAITMRIAFPGLPGAVENQGSGAERVSNVLDAGYAVAFASR